jgi:DNA polymerase elongation subunit (family B)
MKWVYEKYILLSKKRYAGVYFKKGKMEWDWKGLEARRTDTSLIGKQTQEAVIKSLLTGGLESELEAYLRAIIIKFLNGGYQPMEIAIPTHITKSLGSYKHNSIQKKAAYNSNRMLGTNFGEGDKPYRIYVEPYNISGEGIFDVFAIDDEIQLPSWFKIDYAKMLRLTLYKKLAPILSVSIPRLVGLFPEPPKKIRKKKEKVKSTIKGVQPLKDAGQTVLEVGN